MSGETGQLDIFTHADVQPVPWTSPDTPKSIDLPASSDRPLCNLCGRPAAWRPNLRQWSRYCTAGSGCVARVRLCKYCGKPFNVTTGQQRYCSDEHRVAAYRVPKISLVVACPVDGTEHNGKNRWNLCGHCFATIRPVWQALRDHNVAISFVVELIKNPRCPTRGCGRPLLERDPARMDRMPMVVDHDHAHCPGAKSCGICVRGLVCWRCNVLGDDPIVLRGRAEYLEAWGRMSD